MIGLTKTAVILTVALLGFFGVVGVSLATDEISAGSADLRIVGNDGDAVGAGVAVGDLNGDQVPDLAVGARGG